MLKLVFVKLDKQLLYKQQLHTIHMQNGPSIINFLNLVIFGTNRLHMRHLLLADLFNYFLVMLNLSCPLTIIFTNLIWHVVLMRCDNKKYYTNITDTFELENKWSIFLDITANITWVIETK